MSFFKKFFSNSRKSKQGKKYESTFDHEGWLNLFKDASANRSYDALHGLRIALIDDTFRRLDAGWYTSCTGEAVKFEKGVHKPEENTKDVIPYDFMDKEFPELPPMEDRPFQKTEVFVRNADCVIEALKMLDEGMKPAVINMANANNPGGGYLSGSGAQEENLFRRSNCNNFLDPNRNGYNPNIYPIPLIGGHYVPGVTIFRGPESEGYPLLPEPKKIDVLTVAALSFPEVYYDSQRGEYMMYEKDVETSYRKICVLYEMAREQGNDGIVLSAIGCGAFRNPPKQVAELFLEATKKYYGFFKQIVFAIFDDHNARKRTNPDGNFQPFKVTFEGFNFEEWNPNDFKEEEVFKLYTKEKDDDDDSSVSSDSDSHRGKHNTKHKKEKAKRNKKKKKSHEEEEEDDDDDDDDDDDEKDKTDGDNEKDEIELRDIPRDGDDDDDNKKEIKKKETKEERSEDKPPEEKKEKHEDVPEGREAEEDKTDEGTEEHTEKHKKHKHKKHNEEEEREIAHMETDGNEEEKEDEKHEAEEPTEDDVKEKKEHKHKKHKEHSKKHHI